MVFEQRAVTKIDKSLRISLLVICWF